MSGKKRPADPSSQHKEGGMEDRLHNTKFLLKQYRRIAYSVQVSENELNLRMEMDAAKKSYQKLLTATDELVKSQFIGPTAHNGFNVHAVSIGRCA